MNRGDTTHRRHYRIDLPESGREEWDSEPCDCDLKADHDEGQEHYDGAL